MRGIDRQHGRALRQIKQGQGAEQESEASWRPKQWQTPSRRGIPMAWISGFFDISLDAANRLYTWGWGLSVSGAMVTMLGVGMLWIGTRVRDHDFDENIARLHDSAALSEERSKQLEKSNLELATVLERERGARAHIEAGLATRHVRPEQRAALIDALKGAKLAVVISKYGDAETSTYAGEVASALRDAGAIAEEGSTIMSGGGNLAGLFVEETSDPRLINALVLAGLATQKLKSEKNVMMRTGEGLNAIVVGLKPNPF
jgi:hypothetical protein